MIVLKISLAAGRQHGRLIGNDPGLQPGDLPSAICEAGQHQPAALPASPMLLPGLQDGASQAWEGLPHAEGLPGRGRERPLAFQAVDSGLATLAHLSLGCQGAPKRATCPSQRP